MKYSNILTLLFCVTFFVQQVQGERLSKGLIHRDRYRSSIDPVFLRKDTSQTQVKHHWDEMIGEGHYFLTPTAFNLKKKEFIMRNPEIFSLLLSYGITSNLSISGGLSFIPGVRFENQWFYFTPKYTFTVTNHMSLGFQYSHVFSQSGSHSDLITVLGTFGNRDRNLTLGLTITPFDPSSEAVLIGPGITAGGVFRLHEDYAFIADSIWG